MPWNTPTLRDVRSLVRDAVNASLPGADANVPNSVLRVLSDNQGALCHLTLQYIDWLALQLLPDSAETEWLDRHAYIWLVNADGSTGRKLATPSLGEAEFIADTGVGVIVPNGTILGYGALTFQTTAEITTDDVGANAPIRSLDTGTVTNLLAGTTLTL